MWLLVLPNTEVTLLTDLVIILDIYLDMSSKDQANSENKS